MALSGDHVRERLLDIEGWAYDGKQISRLFALPSFMDAIRFVNRVAELAERANHHPDMDVRYDTVRVAVSTHSARGITEKDFALAGQINALETAPEK